MNRRSKDAADRHAERRRREDEAPRLAAEVPKLESLKLELEARKPGLVSNEVKSVKRVVVEHAPALFDIPCAEPSCQDGGHDITSQVMAALRNGVARLEGERPCFGRLGNVPCERVLKYVAVATYKP